MVKKKHLLKLYLFPKCKKSKYRRVINHYHFKCNCNFPF